MFLSFKTYFVFTLFVITSFILGINGHAQTSSGELLPQANAGIDRGYEIGASVKLNGSGSTSPDGSQLSYQWSVTTQPDDSLAVLTDIETPFASLIPDVAGTYVVSLRVTDSEGRISNIDEVVLSQDNLVPVSNAGNDMRVASGGLVTFDPSGTIDPNGDALELSWSVIEAPQLSEAQVEETDAGRATFAPDQDGIYIVELAAVDTEGGRSTDQMTIYAGGVSGNTPPVARAGRDSFFTLDSGVQLDGSQSSDDDGDVLSYSWSIISAPIGSDAVLENPNAVRFERIFDVPGDYIFQLQVSDGVNIAYDTVLISSNAILPLAISGGPDANVDGVILDNLATVSGEVSQNSTGQNSNLKYEWSLASLPSGEAEITDVASAQTEINFTGSGEGVLSDPLALSGLQLLARYNVIICGNLNSRGRVEGRTLIGGDLNASRSKFATHVTDAEQSSVLDVVGHIRGRKISIENGGNVTIGGRIKGHIKFENGGQIISNSSLSIDDAVLQTTQLSRSLKALPKNSDVIYPRRRRGTAILEATPDENGVAVFNIHNGNWLFNNRRVRKIDLRANGAKSIIVNVGGHNVIFGKGYFTGEITSDAVSSKVIWNFHDTRSLKLYNTFKGSVLAPHAFVHTGADVDGNVVALHLIQRGTIGGPGFDGDNLVTGGEGEAADYALVQLKVTDDINPNIPPSYSTTILTSGNRRPVSGLSSSASGFEILRDVEVELYSQLSFDPDDDNLTYDWALISRPPESSTQLTSRFSAVSGFTPDIVGEYVVQLRVSDGTLVSVAKTLYFKVINGVPVADAGEDQVAFLKDKVILSGANSSDPDGDELKYIWAFTQKPAQSITELSNAADIAPEFIADRKGEYILSLSVNDGREDSAVDTVTVTVENRQPEAIITTVDKGVAGDLIALSAERSSDPDGDALSYIWSLIAPEGSSVMINDSSLAGPVFTADLPGSYEVKLIVSDGEVQSEPVVKLIIIAPGNQAPEMQTLSDQTVMLGGEISFAVVASDPEGDGLTYFVRPLPLAAGASFNSETGVFRFRPTAGAQGDYSLSFGVSDGQYSDQNTITISVISDPVVTVTSYSGRVVDAQNGEPVSGARVKVGDQEALSNSDGVFIVSNIEAGRVIICVESGTALAPNGEAYGDVTFTADIIEDVVNEAPRDIELPAALTSAQLVAGQDVILSDANSFGVSLTIPAESVEGVAPGESISLVGLDAAQASVLPQYVVPCQLFSLSPKAVSISQPVTLSVENYDNLPANAAIDIWAFREGDFTLIGQGQVSSNGARLSAEISNMRGGEAIALAPQMHSVNLSSDQPQEVYNPSLFGEGSYQTSYSLPSYSSLGQDRAVSMVYNSQSARPDLIIAAQSDFTDRGLPLTVKTQIQTAGVNQNFVDYIDPEGQVLISQPAIISGSELEAGRVPFKVLSTAQYSCSQVTATIGDEIFVNDQSESPFGAGWTLPELQRLDIRGDVITVVEGTGITTRFENTAPEPLVEEFNDGFGGWTLLNDFRYFRFEETGGNPGGYLEYRDEVRGDTVYWAAPEELSNRIGQYEGGTLNFDLRQTSVTRQYSARWDIALRTSDPDKVLIVNWPNSLHPGTAWTSYSIPLSLDYDIGEGFGWGVYSFAANDVDYNLTQETFSNLLNDAINLQIRAEFRTGLDIGSIDNVIVRPPMNANDELEGFILAASFEGDKGDFTRLYELDDGTYLRRYPNGSLVKFNSEGRQSEITDRNGNTTAYTYDGQGRVDTITDPTGQQTRFVYVAKNLSSIIDPSGRETFFAYDVTGNLMRIENPEGEVSAFSYDANSKMIAQIDPRGNLTSHSYGVAGVYSGTERPDGTSVSLEIAKSLGLKNLGSADAPRRNVEPGDRITTYEDGRGNRKTLEVNGFGSTVRLVDALGREKRFIRNEDNLVIAVIEPSDVTADGTIRTEMDYDENGYVIAKRDAVGTDLQREQSYQYDPKFSQLIRSVDADDFETNITLDDNGNALTVTDPLGGQIVSTYNDQGQLLTRSDKNENIMSYSYDSFGRVERMTDPNGIITRLVLSPEGNVFVRVEAEGTPEERRITMGYDAMNRMIIETEADGGSRGMEYNKSGDLTFAEDATGIAVSYRYDSLDRLVSINDPALGLTVMEYDADGNMVQMTDALGEATQVTYDAESRVTGYVDAAGQLRSFDLDNRDNIFAITDARANTTQMQYDELDRPVSIENPNGEIWQFAYDARDNRTSMTKPDNVVVTTGYDGLSRITAVNGTANAITGRGAVARDYAYDPQSNVTAANDNLDSVAGAQLTFSYDNENRLATASVTNLFGNGALNNTFTYGYDTFDRRNIMSDNYGGITRYGYDPVDRLTHVTTPRGTDFVTNYDVAGRVLGRIAPNSAEHIRSYQQFTGRLKQQRHSVGGASFGQFDFDYTDRGNIEQIAESGEFTRTKTYAYDELERLTQVSVPDAPDFDEDYTLDPEGNRVASHLSQSHQIDSANRLLSDDDYTYVYSLNGNLIAKRARPGSGKADWDYVYDALDLLIEARRDDIVVERYRYDALGRRSVIDNAAGGAGDFVRTAIVNDGPDRSLDLREDSAATAALHRRYTHSDNVDEPLLMEAFNDNGAPAGAYSYHADYIGTVRYMTDETGQVVNAYEYDSYGRPLFIQETVAQPFAYTGREYDSATGLYHYRARSYDASTGRFMQEDPIGFLSGDLNLYRYVLSNPLAYSDPSGLTPSTQYGATAGRSAKAGGGYAAVGYRISCTFTALAGAFELLQQDDITSIDVFMVGTETAMACGAKGKRRSGKNKDKPGKTCGVKKCFAAGTLVHTDDGLKPIEQIIPGDMVKSMDTVTGEIAYKPVTEIHTNQFDPVGQVTLLDEIDGSETILSVTATHPFYSQDRDWVHASKLKVGEKLIEDGGGTLTVTSVSFNPNAKSALTYNLTVADYHTYFVGEDGVLVHNGTVFVDGGVTATFYTGDHGPPHIHISGEGPDTRIGQNGKPLSGDPELSPRQRKACGRNKSVIRLFLKKRMKEYRKWRPK